MKLKRQPDPRHAEVKAILAKYWAAERNELVPELPWTSADAGALGQFLRGSPSLTVEHIKQMLRHRFASEDHARGEPVFVWIKYLTRYAAGPLNKFKQPKKGVSDVQPTRADRRNEHAAGATSAALSRVRRLADR